VTLRPQGWVVQFRLRWYERVLLGYGVFIGLFFAVVSLGGFGFLVKSTLDGTLLPPGERTVLAIGQYLAVGLFALWFGSFCLRWCFGSLIDLFGAEAVLYGTVEELTVHQGTKGRWYSAVVAGECVEMSSTVFETLEKGDPVWMRVGRFQRSLKELATPDHIVEARIRASSRPGVAPAAAVTPSIAMVASTSSASQRAKAHGPIPDAALRRSHVPAPTAPWSEVERLALSWPGDAGPEVSALFERHEKARTLPDTLGELRAMLFLEQRRHRHVSRAPTGESLARVRAIVEAIRARVPPGTPT
jgi:hypothetical protein